MKRIVSVSLGASQRDKSATVDWFGETVEVSRIGTDGDLAAFRAKFLELDGHVDAIGVGGADIRLWLRDCSYEIKQIAKIISQVKKTPVVDGSGLKHTLEDMTIRALAESGQVQFKGTPALMVSAVDRVGMALALEDCGAKVTYGDIMFGLGFNRPLRTYREVERFGRVILPIVTRLPIQWFYPTGKQQLERKPKYEKVFKEAKIVAGDWHYIRRYMPDRMVGKTVITQTLRKADLEFLRQAGVETAVSTTPEVEGETMATNVMEAAMVAVYGQDLAPGTSLGLSKDKYRDILKSIGWRPQILNISLTKVYSEG